MSAVTAPLLVALLAFAAPDEEGCNDGEGGNVSREQLVSRAISAFEEEEYETAVENFQAAYDAEGRAVDLFNIGRVYEESGNPDAARRHYQMFLESEGLSAKERKAAEERLAALPPAEEGSEEDVEASVPAPRVDQEDGIELANQDDLKLDRKTKHHWSTITGATLLPVGVVGLVAGGVLAGTASANRKNADKSADENTPVEETPHFKTAQNQARAANAMFVTGGIVTAAGIVFLATGLDRERKEKKQEKQLTIAPGGTSIHLTYRF